MLQLKHLRYINLLTGTPIHEIKPVKFGYEINYTVSAQYTLASQQIPNNMSLLVLRVQVYTTQIDNTTTDYGFYRTIPTGVAWWVIGNAVSGNIQNWTNPNAPSQLALDADELLLFPSGKYASLFCTPTNAAPSGTWRIRTTVFGYFVPATVSDALGGPQDWINVQQ